MPDGVTVRGPDGNNYQFPDGTDKTAAIAYFKKNDISAPTAESSAPDATAQARQKILGMGQGMEPSFWGGAHGTVQQEARLDELMKHEPEIEANIHKQVAVAAGSMIAPELLPAMGSGGGLLGFLGRTSLKSLAAGAGAGAGNVTGQVLAGDDPLSRENAIETAKIAGFTTALAVPLEALGGLAKTTLGQGAINSSMGVTARDLTYANPARALLREEIHDISSGSINDFQEALRTGKTPTEAAQAAGGRFAAVSQRINELTPRLGKILNASEAQIPVANVIDKPLEDATIEVIKNPAMTDAEKMAAIGKLGDLQKSLKEGLGETATPSQLQTIKQAVGNRVNWGGTSAITDDVKAAYRSVYGSLKEAIHASVPGSAEIDNRLTDLLGASSELTEQGKAELAGRLPFGVMKFGQKEVGRVLPAATNAPALTPAGATIGQQILSKGKNVPQAPPNQPGMPFHPGSGL